MSLATLDEVPSTVWGVAQDDVGSSIRARRTALGMSVRALAAEAGVDRSRVTTVEDGGSVRSATLGAIEAALSRLEEEVSGPYDHTRDQITQTIKLPDGTEVTYVGSVDNVVEAAERFLSRRLK